MYKKSKTQNVIIVLLLLAGVGTGTLLLGQSQDIRERAQTVSPNPTLPPARLASESKPITLSQITVTNIARENALVTWKTNVASNSRIEYGKTEDYGLVETSLDVTKEHSVTLTNLSPGTVYNFTAMSEAPGSYGESDNYTFKTRGYDISLLVIKENQEAIPNARVTLYPENYEMTSNESGEVLFQDVTLGKHGLLVRYNNQTLVQEIVVEDKNDLQTFSVPVAEAPTKLANTTTIPFTYFVIAGVSIFSFIVLLLLVVKRPRARTVVINSSTDRRY